ncbi:MAG: putative threonine dehydratase, partial [Gemmatimonadetes bacterium]|nr:putative threonine dehydratase [Gemmatimonadota bacterium]
MLPTPADVIAAAYRLRPVVSRTPLVRSSALSERASADVYLKCENLQRTGSFKLRGAYNALATMSASERARGVVASSAGNHGLGIALAAQMLGVRLRVFVPSTAPAVKRDGIRALGADVDETPPHYDAAHETALAYASAHDMTFVSPCAGEPLLAGQGTIALEILEELPSLGTVVIPFGGGGLAAGIATLLRAAAPSVRIIGVQSDRTNALAVALEAGRIVEIEVPATLADGLSGQVDETGLALGKFALDEVRVVTEDQVAEAIRFIAREHDMTVEGSGAVSVASILSGNIAAPAGPVVLILSGA